MREQLERLLGDPVAADVAVTLSMSHRFMHFEGRPLLEALPRAVDDIDDYEWMEGEVLGGMVLGLTQSLGAQIDPALIILGGHLVFLAVLAFRPQGLLPGRTA